MNYYEHHLGDYAEATAHLSFVEDAAYSKCIRKYYATECPLPADVPTTQRLVGARTKEEKDAVATILNEFFSLREDGWHQERCDAEIERFQAKSRSAKASANARWSHSERNATALRWQSDGNALQSPIPSNQSPISRSKTPLNPPPEVIRVFDHWRSTWNHPDAKLDDKRRARIGARLKNFTVDQLRDAISGFRNSDWHRGLDPQGGGKIYDKIETLLRDDSQVEEGLRLFTNPPRPFTKADKRLTANVDVMQQFIEGVT